MAEPLTRAEIADMEIPIPDSFRGFAPHEPVRIYTRNLPHWRQDGATYFATFRQADSIPPDIWKEMCKEAEIWKKRVASATRGGLELPNSLRTDYEQFLRRYWGRLEKLLDQCSGSCALRYPEVRKLVSDAVTFFDKKRHDFYAAVVMPNHCHVAIRPYEGHELENILQSWKSYTALQINRKLGISGEFWQGDSFDRIIRDEEHYRKVVRYISRNPVKAKLRVGEFWLRFGDRTW